MGAWEFGPYKATTRAYDNPRLGAALVAIKNELAYNGFGNNLIVDTPVYGEAAENRAKEFQAAHGLKVDGQVGPTTAKELFRKRTNFVESSFGFAPGTIGKLVTLESAWDPVAIGYADPDDHGMSQINLRIHSDVTVEQSYNPAFALNWTAEYIKANQERIVREINVEKAARASYNIGPEYAKRWMNAGYPASGGVFDSTGLDWFDRATTYIQTIDKQAW